MKEPLQAVPEIEIVTGMKSVMAMVIYFLLTVSAEISDQNFSKFFDFWFFDRTIHCDRKILALLMLHPKGTANALLLPICFSNVI
jgi:hypothetical protein